MNIKDSSILSSNTINIDGTYSVGKSTLINNLINELRIEDDLVLSSNRVLTNNPDFFSNGDPIMNSYLNLLDRRSMVEINHYRLIDRSPLNDLTYSILINSSMYQYLELVVTGNPNNINLTSLSDLLDTYFSIRKPWISLSLINIDYCNNGVFLLCDKPMYNIDEFLKNSSMRINQSNKTLVKVLGKIDPDEFRIYYNFIYTSIAESLGLKYYLLSEVS